MKKALVLAGGFPQIALIEELKKRDVWTVLADWNENPVARKHADAFYQASTLDVEAIETIARQERVDFLITACTDQALLTVAQVSEKLGLPCYIDYQTALNVTNKSYMKAMFSQHDVPTAPFAVMGVLDMKKITHLRYPMIVKPVDCNSSKGVCKVQTQDELKAAFAEAVRLSRTQTAIVEEFVQGPEISVDVYVEDGVAHVLSVTNSEKIKSDDKFVIFRAKYPAIAKESIYTQIRETAQKIADAFGLKNSPMLIQFISDGERVYVLEFSARTGGGVKFLLIRHVSGFDVIKAVVDLTMGLLPHVENEAPVTPYLVNDFIYCQPGVFDRLVGFEELKQQGILKDYYQFKEQGAAFDGVRNSGDRVAGYTVVGNTPEELIARHEQVLQTIRVLDNRGQDMARHDLLTHLRVENGNLISE